MSPKDPNPASNYRLGDCKILLDRSAKANSITSTELLKLLIKKHVRSEAKKRHKQQSSSAK